MKLNFMSGNFIKTNFMSGNFLKWIFNLGNFRKRKIKEFKGKTLNELRNMKLKDMAREEINE